MASHPSRAPEAGRDTESATRQASDSKFAESLRWIGLVRLFAQLGGWAVTLLVARILPPSAYGVVAAGTSYVTLLRLLTEFGLATALVARRSVTRREMDQVGTLALIGGVATVLLTTVAAPWIAAGLREPALAAILPVLSIGSGLAAVNAVPIAALQRQLKYREVALAELARSIIGASVLLTLAIGGFGYWSLVGSEVAAGILFSIFVFIRAPFRVVVPRLKEVRGVLINSAEILGSRLAWYVSNNADIMIVSRALGASSLGMYTMSWTLTNAPSEKLTSVVFAVTPGIFSRSQDNLPELRRYFLATLEALLYLVMPASFGLAIVAPDLVPLLLGDRWSPAVPLIQVLGVLVPLKTVTPLCGQVLVALQRSRLVMIYAVGLALALPIAFVVGARSGVQGVALAWALTYPPFSALQFLITSRQLGVPAWALLSRFFWPAFACLCMFGATRALQWALADAIGAVRLSATIAGGAAAYATVLAVFRRQQVMDAVRFIRSRG